MTGGRGHITTAGAGECLIRRVGGLDLEDSGTLRHSDGSVPPWQEKGPIP